MENLRQQIERDLHDSIESEWGIAVELTSPDGEVQKYSANNPDELLKGQVLYFSKREDPATGETVVVPQPVVALRLSSLSRVPIDGETWHILMPVQPTPGAPRYSFVFTPDRAREHGTDIGFIRIYPYLTAPTAEPEPVS